MASPASRPDQCRGCLSLGPRFAGAWSRASLGGGPQRHQAPDSRRWPMRPCPRYPGAVAAVVSSCAKLGLIDPTPCSIEGHGQSVLLVAIARPRPLIRQRWPGSACLGVLIIGAPVLDFSIPRRLKPSFAMFPTSQFA